jgi:hypothetical protein
MKVADALALAKDMAGATRDYVARALEPFTARVEAMEQRVAGLKDGERGADGKDGERGKDADPEVVKALVTEAIAAIPIPKDGAPGERGEKGRRARVRWPPRQGRRTRRTRGDRPNGTDRPEGRAGGAWRERRSR